jgi:hypothetical protein
VLRSIMDRFRRRKVDQPGSPPVDRDYVQERENRRLAQMSEEDQAWSAASLQRDREARERNQPPPERERDDGPAPAASP